MVGCLRIDPVVAEACFVEGKADAFELGLDVETKGHPVNGAVGIDGEMDVDVAPDHQVIAGAAGNGRLPPAVSEQREQAGVRQHLADLLPQLASGFRARLRTAQSVPPQNKTRLCWSRVRMNASLIQLDRCGLALGRTLLVELPVLPGLKRVEAVAGIGNRELIDVPAGDSDAIIVLSCACFGLEAKDQIGVDPGQIGAKLPVVRVAALEIVGLPAPEVAFPW